MKFKTQTNSSPVASSSSNKIKYIIIGVIALIILILLIMMFASGNKSKEEVSQELSKNFEQQQNTTTNSAVTPPPPPPSLDFDESKMNEVTQNSQTAPTLDADNKVLETNAAQSVANDKELNALVNRLDKTDGKNADGSKQSIRPEDMIAYLKAKQPDFSFNGENKIFDFEGKVYKSGQYFKGWWYVEEITPVFIRFVDEESNYAYNLRFLEGIN